MKYRRPKKVSLKKLKGDTRAISPIVATILLVFMTVAAGTAFFLFENGWQKTVSTSLDHTQISSTQVTLAGSTTVANLMNTIVPAFENGNVGIKISYAGSGSGAGLLAVEKRSVDVGMISNYEDQVILGTSTSHANLVQSVIAYDGFSLFLANATLSYHGITVPAGKYINMNQTIADAIYQMNLPTGGTSAVSLGVNQTVVTAQQNQTDIFTFGPASAAGTARLTLQDGTQVSVAFKGGEDGNTVAHAFAKALPHNWTAPASSYNGLGQVTFIGPCKAPTTTNSKMENAVSGALPQESGFTDGNSTSPAKDTLTFAAASAVGTIIVTMPDRTTNITVVTSPGESANAVAKAFQHNLTGVWSAPIPTGNIVNITGPINNGYSRSNAINADIGTLPSESGFIDGILNRSAKDTLTFATASAVGTIVVTMPDRTTNITVVTSPGESANAVAKAFQHNLTGNWSAPVPTGNVVTITGPQKSGYTNSTVADRVSGARPQEKNFKDGNKGSNVKDVLTFATAKAIGTVIVTMPDRTTNIAVVTSPGESANAVAKAFQHNLTGNWTAPIPTGSVVTISGPQQGGYNKSKPADGVTGALPTESNFVVGHVGAQAITDTLTFGGATANGTIIITLPTGTLVPLMVTNGETAVAVASAFQSALPSGWNLISQFGSTVTFSGPEQSGHNSTAINVVSGSLPKESGFKQGNTTTNVEDTLTFSPATASGTIIITLPDNVTKIPLFISAGKSANAVAIAFQHDLTGVWTAPVPTGSVVTMTGPQQGGYTNSTAIDLVSGAMPTESGFINGRAGVQGVTDTLTFGPANAVGTILVTLPDGTTNLTMVISSAPRTAIQVASAFQSALPSGWNLISQIGSSVTFSSAVLNGHASKATDGVSGSRPSESNFTNGIPITHATDTLTFNSASTNGTIVVTLPNGTQVPVVVKAGWSANAVALAFQSALPAGWSVSTIVGGVVNITGPQQSGYTNSTAADRASGARPAEKNFTDGNAGSIVKDKLTFGVAKSNGTIIVTMPDKTNVTMVVTIGESANAVAKAFQHNLTGNWTAPVPTGNVVNITGPQQGGYTASSAADRVSGARPAERDFMDGNPGGQAQDTLNFGLTDYSVGTINVKLPNGTSVYVDINAPKTAVQVASMFVAALPDDWTLVRQDGSTVTFSGPMMSGDKKSNATCALPNIALFETINNTGNPGNYLPKSLPSWGALTNGFIRTWGDLETVLMAQGSITFTTDSNASDPLNVYYRTDSSDTQDAFSLKALGTNSSGKIGGTLPSAVSAKGVYGEEALISACVGDKNGIGFATISSLISTPGVEVCSWNKVRPTNQHIIDSVNNYGKAQNQYALWHPLILVTNGRPTGSVQTFINWIMVPTNNLAVTHAAGLTSLYEAR